MTIEKVIMKYQGILICIALPIIAIGSFVFFKQKDMQRDTAQFIVGTAAGYAPFVSINQQGEYEGFDIDVANALAKQMERSSFCKIWAQ